MKVVLSACVLAAVALSAAAAPALSQGENPAQSPAVDQQALRRQKRSNYGSAYVAPCGAASAPIPAIAPSYQYNIAPVHHGGYASHHGAYAPHPVYAPHAGYAPQVYGLPHQYRSEFEDEQEMLGFSDMDPHMSEQFPMMARYAYAAPAPAHYGAAGLHGLEQLVAPAASGPAIGIFPRAKTGGCSVPLLLSCSPSIVEGRIVKDHGNQYGAAGPIAYRDVDEQAHHEGHEEHEENAANEHMPTHEATHAGHASHTQ